jgi:hypothetical protein
MYQRLVFTLAAVALLAGCATVPPKDLTAFRAANPASMLVLPPLNETPEPNAVHGVMAQLSLPLAEAGYYVMPVSMVAETFRQNGMQTSHDIHQISFPKLREVFGADAAVYVTVKQYGTKYMVVASDTIVAVEARIVDLRSGAELWKGQASAASSEEGGSSQQGIVGLLVKALVEQILNTATDRSFPVAGRAVNRLFAAGTPQGIPPGPRLPVAARP